MKKALFYGAGAYALYNLGVILGVHATARAVNRAPMNDNVVDRTVLSVAKTFGQPLN